MQAGIGVLATNRGDTMTQQAKLIEVLERLIDDNGLYSVTEAMALVCFEKAEHLLVNWQDREAARRWERGGKAFHTAHATLERIQLPGA